MLGEDAVDVSAAAQDVFAAQLEAERQGGEGFGFAEVVEAGLDAVEGVHVVAGDVFWLRVNGIARGGDGVDIPMMPRRLNWIS